MAKKLVIMEQKDFTKLAIECNFIDSALSLAKESNDIEFLRESLKSIEKHLATIQNILEKED